MKRNYVNLCWTILLLGLVATSCNDFLKLEDFDTDDVNFKTAQNPDFVFPLATGEAQLNEILKGHKIGSDYLVAEGDKLFIRYEDKNSLTYKFSDIFNRNIPANDNLIEIPKNGFPKTVSADVANLTTIWNQMFPEQTEFVDFELPTTIKEVNEFMFDCTINLQAEGTPLDLNSKIVFPELKDEKGNTLTLMPMLKKGSTTKKSFSLKNIVYKGANKGNKVKLSCVITTTASATNTGTIDLVQGNKIDLKLSFENIMPIRFKGKTLAIKKNFPKFSNDVDFEDFDEMDGLKLFGSKLMLNIATNGILGEAKLVPIFTRKNNVGNDVEIAPKILTFNSVEKTEKQTVTFEGKEVETVIEEFLKNNIETKAEMFLNPNETEFAFNKDTEIKAGFVFEQPLNFSLKDMEINYTTDKLESEDLLKDYKESLDNCSLEIVGETDIPLEIALANIEILDKDEKPIGHSIKVDGSLKGSANGKLAKSRVLAKISRADIDKMIEQKEVFLQFNGHLKSIDEKQVALKPNQKLKLKVIFGINHNF